jgi:nucleotide-binding universal stress UspA family protein
MEKEFARVIIPIDGSDNAKNAAKKAFFIAKNIDVEVIIICVLDPFRYSKSYEFFHTFTRVRREQAEKYIDEIFQMGKSMNIKCSTRLIDRGMPFEEIIKSANKDDLIILGSKGHSNIERILVGNVSEKVIRHAKCSVMIVR